MIGPRFVLKHAWRESRAARRRLWLLTGSVIAGVAALVAINSFTDNLRTSVAEQSQALLGADLVLSSRQPPSAATKAWIDSLIAPAQGQRGAAATVISFAGMAYVPRTAGVRLVQVRAVDPGYPYYGQIKTDPAGRWGSASQGGTAVVDPSLLSALGARVGDSLSLGQARFVIDAAVVNMPGDVGVATAFGPRVFIAARDLAATELIRQGSRLEYETFIKLPVASQAQKLADDRRPALRNEHANVRTINDDRQDLSDTLSRLGNYLGLVALVALLLGGLGVASATRVFIRQKLDTIAVLRCLGATGGEVFAIYLLQAVAMGLLGSLVGAGLGVAAQLLLPSLVKDLLPVDVHVAFAPRAVLLGIGLGIWVAAVFSLVPLLGVRRVPPLMTLRRDVDPESARRDPMVWLGGMALAATIVAVAVLQAGNRRDGFAFAGGVGAAILVLWLGALGLIRAVRRWPPRRWPYLWRQGVANLHRPANQTVMVVLSLGFGVFLLATLFLVQDNLLRQFQFDGPGERPNLLFFDIQPDQQQGVAAVLQGAGHPGSPMVPIVPMRITAVKGVPVKIDSIVMIRDSSAADPGAASSARPRRGQRSAGDSTRRRPDGWAVRHEYRSTYRDSLTGTETLVSGQWWQGTAVPGKPVEISLDADLAGDLSVGIGDEITWDVAGAPIISRVANLRQIDWRRFQTNFFVVFQTGALERAPQMLVTLARADSAAVRGQLQRQVAERYPNVSAIDLSLVQQTVEGILTKAALGVRFLALFSVAAGLVVLIGAVMSTRRERIRESVLLKTIGATRGQVLRILLAEYVALGALAAGLAIVLSSVAGWALAKWVFEAPFTLPLLSLSGLAVTSVALTLGVGLWNSAEILRQPPLYILRGEL